MQKKLALSAWQGNLRRCSTWLKAYDITKGWFPPFLENLSVVGVTILSTGRCLPESTGEVKFAWCGTFNKQSRLCVSPWCHDLKRGVQVQVPLLLWHVHFPFGFGGSFMLLLPSHPNLACCLISVQAARRRQSVHRAPEYIPNSHQTCAVSPPPQKILQIPLAVLFFCSGIDLSAAAQFDPGCSATLLPYVSRMHAEFCVCVINADSVMCLLVYLSRSTNEPYRGHVAPYWLLSPSLQLASNRKKISAETATVDMQKADNVFWKT